MPRFGPKLASVLKTGYSRRAFFSDVTAGVVVGVVAIPLAIAFGIASGVEPQRGLFTAIVAGLIISLLGGSRVSIGGPTGAFVVVVYGIVHQFGYPGLAVATLLAGVLLLLMGVARLGSLIQFVPHPVIVGFTSGIAIIIFTSQIKDFLGLQLNGPLPADFLEKWPILVHQRHTLNPYAVAIAAGTVLLSALWPRRWRLPASLVALAASAWIAHALALPVETIGSRFGELPHTLPAPRLPAFTLEELPHLVQPAFTIALLGAVESLLCAVVADGMIGGRHRPNTELVAQGVANTASALFGGIPATGAIARTVTNIRNGGRSPVAGVVHSVTIVIVLLCAAPLADAIPMACLAGILTVVAYNMSEWHSFASLLRGPRSDVSVLLVTFFLTVLVDLTVAIEVGMVLAAFLFMSRMAEVTHVRLRHRDDADEIDALRVPEGIEAFEIVGPFFFGASHKFEETLRALDSKPRARVLGLSHVPVIDATGLHSLKQLHRHCRRERIPFVVAGLRGQPLKAVKEAGLFDEIGPDNFAPDMHKALRRAEEIMRGTPPVSGRRGSMTA
jgi:SulP family sulfate permease